MRLLFLVLGLFFWGEIHAQIGLDKLKDAADKAQDIINNKTLSESDITIGLKEALIVGAINSVKSASKTGGFNSNLSIKIPFPENADKMKSSLVGLGFKTEVEHFEFVLNEAAEEASNRAKDIFVSAVNNMDIRNARAILSGDKDAATKYLRESTFIELYDNFKPIVNKSIESVNLGRYWAELSKSYNSIPLTKKINTDLEDYVTRKAIDGLFFFN